MNKPLSLAAATFLTVGASIGCAGAASYNLTDFTFTPSGDITGITQTAASAVMHEPSSSPNDRPTIPEVARLDSNFTLSGDFSFSVTQDFTIPPPVNNLAGNQEIAAVEVSFGGNPNGVMLAAFRDDENGFFHVVNLDNTFVNGNVYGASGLGVGSNTFQFSRVGDVLTIMLSFGNKSFSITDPNDLGPASIAFYFENGNNNRSEGEVTWSNFSVQTAATPLPAALPLFATGLGALGLLGWRGKRKAKA